MSSESVKSANAEVVDGSSQGFRFFLEERRFIAANKAHIWNAYSGRYIAILGTSILDSDTDFSALAERVYKGFGYRRIFMPFVGTHKVYRIPSPRLAR